MAAFVQKKCAMALLTLYDVIAVRGGVPPPPQKRVGNSVWEADTKGLLDKKCTLVICVSIFFLHRPRMKRHISPSPPRI